MIINNTNGGLGVAATAGYNSFGFMTVTNSTGDGLSADTVPGVSVYQTFTANHAGNGIELDASWTSTVAQVLSYSNGAYGMRMVNNTYISVRSGVRIGANTGACLESGGTDVELDNSCNYNVGTASAPVTGIDASTSFIGQVSTDDSSNNADTNGVATSTTINDANLDLTEWVNFENSFRLWGISGSTFPDPDNRVTTCKNTTCQIWDFRLEENDSAARNVNGTFVADTTCPNSVNGVNPDNYIAGVQGTHLINAFEIVNDRIGNENGLCESNEACIFAPNIGAYQGEGDYSTNGTCTFVDGVITGVTMYAYPTNGAAL